MILIAQRTNGPQNAEVVARLIRAGHRVFITHSQAEAREVVEQSDPRLVILDSPQVDRCPNLLCGWIREADHPAPKLLGLVRINDPEQRARCEACLTVLPPDTDPSLVTATAMALVNADE